MIVFQVNERLIKSFHLDEEDEAIFRRNIRAYQTIVNETCDPDLVVALAREIDAGEHDPIETIENLYALVMKRCALKEKFN